MTSDKTPGVSPRMTWGRAFRIGFIVLACLSLLMNAVVIGIGVRLADRGLLGGGVGQVLAEMPRDTRRAFARDLKAEQPRLRSMLHELRAHRKRMLELAAARPGDPQALAEAMADVRAATTRLQAAAHEIMLETVERRSGDDG